MNPQACSLFTWPMRAWLGAALITLLLAGAVQVKAQQPVWSATGSLGTARWLHTATPLPNGKALVVGGLIGCTPGCRTTASAELYDPVTGQWSATGSPATPRGNHVAVRLQNGKVLIASGNGDPFSVTLTSAELYDPDTGTWSAAGNLNVARQSPRATLLTNGKVLVTGGVNTAFLNTAELYDPSTNSWSLTGPMNVPRALHTMTLLPDSRVLVSGGTSSFSQPALRSAELYDPASGNWTLTGQLTTTRQVHAATLLANGKVLVSGGAPGSGSNDPFLAQAELYDPATGQWSATGSMTTPRVLHTLTLLANGKALAASGAAANFVPLLKSAELYDPASGSWTATAALNAGRSNHTATLLSNGRVLIAAGSADINQHSSAELYESGAATVASVSAASFTLGVAPESIVASFGSNLATGTQTASSLPLPTALAGVSVRVRDTAGVERLAPLFFVAPGQINYQIPPGTAAGQCLVNVTSGGGIVAAGVVEITSVAPGLFSANANGQGVAAAVVFRLKADGSQSFEPVARFDSAQNRFVAAPIDLGPDSDQVFLVLYGTGIKLRSALSAVSCAIGGAGSEALFADAAPGFVGLDQVNVRLPRSLAGRGEVDVALSVDGKAANRVRVSIR